MTKIFVYGLLKRGFSLHNLMKTAVFLGVAQTLPQYRLVNCGEYPGLRKTASQGEGIAVQGEVFEVNSTVLKQLDEAEGVDEGLYRRGKIELASPFDQMEIEAWFFNSEEFDDRPAGDRWEVA